MSAKNSNYHWGDWIGQRSHFVGFKRNTDLAAAIGCSGDQLRKWRLMDEPPVSMRKGFDRKLMDALQVDRKTLFCDFRMIGPETAPAVGQPLQNPTAETCRRRVLAMVELMPDDGLKELARVGEQLLRGGILQVA